MKKNSKKTIRTDKRTPPRTPTASPKKKAPTNGGMAKAKDKKLARAALVRTAVTDIGKLLAKEGSSTSMVRYDVGSKVDRLMKEEDGHGKGLVAEVATQLGRDADSLYNFARVAAVWTRTGFRQLAARKNAAGAPLSFSHFVELSRKGGKDGAGLGEKPRMKLLKRALKEKLSVRALEGLVRVELGEKALEPSASTVSQFDKSTRAIVDRTQALGGLVTKLEHDGIAATEVGAFSLTIEQVEKARDVCTTLLPRLEEVRKKAAERPAAAE